MTASPLVVEHSDDGATWTISEAAYPVGEVVEALPPGIGTATIEQPLPTTSHRSYQGDGTAIATTDALEVGAWVRVSLLLGYDATATEILRPVWTGRITERARSIDARTVRYTCQETSAAADRWRASYALTKTSGGTYTLDAWPVFNGDPAGDRSAATTTIAGSAVYIHEPGSGHDWTAQDIIELYLALITEETQALEATALPWVLVSGGAAATAALGRAVEWDLRGMTLWQILGELLGGQVVWWIYVDHAASEIQIRVGDVGLRSLDASTQAWHVTDYDDGAATRAEALAVRSDERPVYTLTLTAPGRTGGELEGDWSAADQTARDTDPADDTYALVYRRYRLASAWDGTSHGALTGLRSPDGDNADDRSHGGLPDPALLEFAPGAAVLYGGVPSLERPGVWLGSDDITERCSVRVGSDGSGPWVEIDYRPEDGSDGGEAIRLAWAASQKLTLTIGIYEPTRRRSQWAATTHDTVPPRRLEVSIPAAEWVVDASATLRSTWTGSGVILARGDLDALRDRLVAERLGPDAPAETIEIVREGPLLEVEAILLQETVADRPCPGDPMKFTNTIHGDIGHARLLERALICGDPRQGVRYRCGRLSLAQEAIPR